jgi:hypothetical protein
VNLACAVKTLAQTAWRDNAVDSDCNAWAQLSIMRQARCNSGKLLIERRHNFTDRGGLDLYAFFAAGQVAVHRRNPHVMSHRLILL